MNQPHKHYDGPITKAYVNELYGTLDTMISELHPAFEHVDPSDEEGLECKMNWGIQIQTCIQKLDSVNMALVRGSPLRPEYDGKIIDIILSVIDDWRVARAANFLKPEVT